MSRLSNIPKDIKLLKIINLALHEFGNEFSVTSSKYFAIKTFFKGLNASAQFTNLLQPHNEKYLKVDELLLILDNLGTHKKIILDELCSRYGYICSSSAPDTNTDNNFEKLFLDVANVNGKISAKYLEAIKDGNIDNEEKKQLDNLLYQFRALVRGYESN